MNTIKDLTKNAIEELARATTRKECAELWEKHLNAIKAHKTLDGGSVSPHTVRKAVSDVRKGLAKSFAMQRSAISKRREKWLLTEAKELNAGKVANLGLVTAGAGIAKASNERHRKSLNDAVANQKELNGIAPLYAELETLLDSWDWRELAIAVAGLTGRRTYEVLKTAKLKRKAKGYFMRFEGQAKSKSIRTSKPYTIPVFGSPRKIENAINRLRSLKDCTAMEQDAINKKYESALRKKVKEVLSPYTNDNVSMHDLRKIYSARCVDVLIGSSEIKDSTGNVITNDRLFIQRILGHENTATGLHYETWKVR